MQEYNEEETSPEVSLQPTTTNTQLTAWGTGGGTPWLAEYERMAQLVAKSVTLPKSYNGDPRTVLAVALTGRELGIGFMQSTRVLYVINGVVTLATEAKLALALHAGHKIVPTERTPEGITVQCETHDSHYVTWSMERASKIFFETWDKEVRGQKIRQSLTEKDNWVNHPEQMLWARAVGQLIREHCPEVCGGLYSKEEIEPEGYEG